MMDLELKKNITDAKGRVNYLKEKLDKAEAMDIYTNANDKNFNKLSECNYNNRRVETYTNWLLKIDKGAYDTRTDKQYNDAEKVKRFAAKGNGNTETQEESQVERLKTSGIQYKSNNLKVTPALLKEESELGEVLREYQPLRELLGQQLQLVKLGQATKGIVNDKGELVPLSFKMIRDNLTEVNSDMLLSIKWKKGLDYERPVPTKVYQDKLNMIDYSNFNHIKKIIGSIWLGETPMNEDDIILVADINKALEAIEPSELDGSIIKMYNEGWTVQQIGEEVKLHHSNVSRRIDKICKIISEQLMENN